MYLFGCISHIAFTVQHFPIIPGKEAHLMKLNAPKNVTFYVCAALIVLGIILYFVKPVIGFVALAIGAVVLALSCILSGL